MALRASAKPAAPLGPFVRGYEHYLDPGDGPRVREHLPSPDVTLIFNLDSPLRVRDSAGRWTSTPGGSGFLAGLHTVPAGTGIDGPERGVEVALTPLGAHRLLGGLPMTNLSDRVFRVDELLGRDALRLSEQLATGDAVDGFDLLDAFLQRTLLGEQGSPEFRLAWDLLTRAHGHVRIRSLAKQIAWSEKRLVAEFRRVTGQRPKTVARLLRFQRARELAGTSASWTNIALACGYHDQAHLTHDVSSFAGCSPADLRRRLRPDPPN